MIDILFIHVNLATLSDENNVPYGAIEDGALAVKEGCIFWLGSMKDMPLSILEGEKKQTIDCEGRWMTPGLVDCHTHLVFAGNRAKEFEMRLHGESYEAIARAGGGIVSTVKATRAASEDELYVSASARLNAMKAQGVTCVEIKSGYGLDLATERKMLNVAERLKGDDIWVRKTFLGAHALPPEFKGDADGYIDLICNEILPALKDEIDCVDGFCENIGFTVAQMRRVFDVAKMHGLAVKLHAEQLSDQGGAALAAQYAALSADHLEYVSEEGLRAMAASGTVAVILPGAFYFLKETKKPPIDLMRATGVSMALATDCNPGSSPISSPLLILNMACTLFAMTPEEALRGMTINGAKALGLDAEIGSLEIGKKADFVVWNIDHPAELSYWIGANPLHSRYVSGRDVTALAPV
ncbi:MAG: imidazolonepropionase [Robiginitomaculum sp.]|nr:MAG: imidazolonepropionase [Robiginitomaculum sp.]